MTVEVRDAGVELRPDDARVIARLYLPGEGYTRTGSRAGDIMDRIEPTGCAAEGNTISFPHTRSDIGINPMARHIDELRAGGARR